MISTGKVFPTVFHIGYRLVRDPTDLNLSQWVSIDIHAFLVDIDGDL